MPLLRMAKERRPCSYIKVFREFTSNTTVHGLSYIGNKSLPVVDRLLWSIVVVVLGSCAACISYQILKEWQSNKVVTVLNDTELPINQLDFPAITICSEGFNMEVVEDVIEEEYKDWKKNKRAKRNIIEADEITEFLKTTYGIKNAESIIEIVIGMISNNPDASFGIRKVH